MSQPEMSEMSEMCNRSLDVLVAEVEDRGNAAMTQHRQHVIIFVHHSGDKDDEAAAARARGQHRQQLGPDGASLPAIFDRWRDPGRVRCCALIPCDRHDQLICDGSQRGVTATRFS